MPAGHCPTAPSSAFYAARPPCPLPSPPPPPQNSAVSYRYVLFRKVDASINSTILQASPVTYLRWVLGFRDFRVEVPGHLPDDGLVGIRATYGLGVHVHIIIRATSGLGVHVHTCCVRARSTAVFSSLCRMWQQLMRFVFEFLWTRDLLLVTVVLV